VAAAAPHCCRPALTWPYRLSYADRVLHFGGVEPARNAAGRAL